MEAHAGHLAEEIAGGELRERLVIRQIDGRIDRDVAASALLRARVRLARGERAADAAEPAAGGILLLDVRDRRSDVDLDRAFEDVERGRTELPFPADHLAGRD